MLTQERPHSLIANHEHLRGLLGTYGPASLQRLRDDALERFIKVGLPTIKDEEFKYTPLTELRELNLLPSYGANLFRTDLENTAVGGIEAITLAFANGEYAPELSTEGILPEGVIFSTLRDALETHEELVLKHLGRVHVLDNRLGTTNDERFRWLNTAYISEGVFLYVPRNTVVEGLLHVMFASRADHGAFAAYPRVLIVLEEGAQAKVLESHVGLSGMYFTNAVTEIVVGKRAHLEHIRFQSESPDAIHVATVAAEQDGSSVLSSNSAQLGAKTSRVDLNFWVGGEHAETWLNGAYVGTGDQLVDNHTRIDHAVANCNSFEVYKGILGGHATGVFNGKIFVYEDAQKTDAKQTNQAILLTPTAQVNTKPQLEIFADDVKCTHGATVGELREDARFYLRSRGIPKQEADAILVYAFAAEVLEKISVQSVRDALEKALYNKLNEEAQPSRGE
ncbi:MAG: Fe-S cluster assembly protein SufD [Fimbriimonadaceae bacterium]|jgi:Fe-S cluster assembly protein SufD|nr:Fe-S cluster assembly protein SufD [Fimbriimonadaceae bacterium]